MYELNSPPGLLEAERLLSGGDSIMAWEKPLYNRGRVDAAGRDLVRDDITPEDREVARAIVNNWRAVHHYPMLATRITLSGRAHKVDGGALVAQRIKKLSSIEIKLRRNPHMQVSQMQDIGGCRAIVSSVAKVDQLVALYKESDRKNPKRAKIAREPYDYIQNPKVDGYRGIHLVYKYQSFSPHHAVYNGQRIEIQIRSRLQHYWATAVEVVDTIAQEGIKIGGGSKEWRRFFALVSSAMAMAERRPVVTDTPADRAVLYATIATLADELRVDSKLRSYAVSVGADSVFEGARMFLLTLNLESNRVMVRGFGASEAPEASAALFATEKENAGNPNVNSVLVGLEKLKNLRSAYPNYYLDTDEFLKFIAKITAKNGQGG